MENSLYGGLYNPDILMCLANLSSDEVFTPPEIANQMLDMLPQELFKDPNTKFLDPACKSGVFLREIVKRLNEGLKDLIPNTQERLDHIFHNQVYGIAITELTSLLSRRSLYCSKYPDSPFSISHFDSAAGNVRYGKTKHRWKNGSCVFCGASQAQYERDTSLETHAYEFIHTTKPEEILKMKFDVVISNPPYQLSTGGGQAQAIPLYDKFVEASIRLNPRYSVMIIPARWYAGGFPCIKSFREKIASSNNIKEIHDFPNASDCFNSVEIKGGVCYFLWERDYQGKCTFYNHSNNKVVSKDVRYLLEPGHDTVIRDNKATEIVHKVEKFNEPPFSNIVGTLWPFTVKSSFDTFSETKKNADDIFAYVMKNKGWIRKTEILKNQELIDKIKLLLPRSVGSANLKVDKVKPILAEDNTCCSGTYIICGPFENKEIAKNAKSYIETRFFHFLLSLKKVSQDTVKGCYDFIPLQDFSKPWTDDDLFKKYRFSKEEINYIKLNVWPEKESTVKSMDGDENDK